MSRAFVRRLQVVNYRSIGQCDVSLGPFTLIVGPNGSGKSNFLDALRFTRDALRATLEQAIRDRGGIDQVRRLSVGHPRHFSVGITMDLAGGSSATFMFRIGAQLNGAFSVQREACDVADGPDHFAYEVREGVLRSGNVQGAPGRIEPDRLYLSVVSALPQFRPVYDVLSRLGFYSLNPDRIRDLQDPDPGELLARDGSNLAGVVRRLKDDSPKTLARVVEYLRAIVPGVRDVRSRSVLLKETLEFDQDVRMAKNPWHFPAASM